MLLIILIIIVGFVYGASMQGITCCNSGSLFALVRAIAEKKKLSINEYIKYTKHIDYAQRNGNFYTDRPPGTSFAAVPIYILRGNVTLVSVISGVLSTALVYLITLQLVNNAAISFLTGLIFAFCTLNWRYSTTFFIHSLSTFLVLLAVYGLFVNLPMILIGIILGLATIVEYIDFMYLGGIILAQTILGHFWAAPGLILGYAIGIIPLLVYNARCFGSPFSTSYKYCVKFKWANSFRTTFVTPLFEGMKGLLFFIKEKDGIRIPGGMFIMSPILIFGVIGYYYLPYSTLVLFLCLTIPLFLLISKHKTYWAGGGGDYRYLSSMVPYLAIPLGFSIKNLIFLWPVMFFLALISLGMVILKMLSLTISAEDLKKMDPDFLTKIKKGSFLEVVRFKYAKKTLILVFNGLFIRKIRLENKFYQKRR